MTVLRCSIQTFVCIYFHILTMKLQSLSSQSQQTWFAKHSQLVQDKKKVLSACIKPAFYRIERIFPEDKRKSFFIAVYTQDNSMHDKKRLLFYLAMCVQQSAENF